MVIKQVIVVRTKYPDGKGGTKGLRAGKLISQAAHSSMAFLRERLAKSIYNWSLEIHPAIFRETDSFSIDLTSTEREWLEGNYAKVCLQVDSEQELMEIAEKAEAAGLECHVITDSGLTEFHGVPTKTCLAIGPDYSEEIDKITGHLRLY